MKILNGISPVSLQSTRDLTRELNRLGHKADNVIFRSNPLLNSVEDQCLNIDLKRYHLYPIYFLKVSFFFLQSILKYDVFHLHFAHSLLPYNLDLPILKAIGKKIFMEYHGTDIRYMINKIENDQLVRIEDSELKQKSIRKQKRIYKYLDGIFLHDRELVCNLYDPSGKLNLLPLRIDLSNFNSKVSHSNERLMIVHAPSKRAVKGSDLIDKIINDLKKDYDIDYVVIGNMNHKQALQVYEKADIIIDQMIIGAYGMLSIEGMALGKTVVCYVAEDNMYDQSNPICNTTIKGLRDCLVRLIEDSNLRAEYSLNGKKYVEKFHCSKKVALMALQHYGNDKGV